MVKTRSQRAVEARALNDLCYAFKIDEIREAIFGQQGYDAVLLETRANCKGGKDKRKAVTRCLDYKLRKEAEIEEVLKKLLKLSKLVRTNVVDSHSGAEGRVWNDNLLWVSGKCLQQSDEEPLELNNITITKGINCKVSRKESFIDVIAREGNELEAVLKELEISSMEEKLSTPELNAPLKLVQLNEIPDGPVDVATVSSTVVRNLAKRKAIKRGVVPCSVTSVLEESNKIVEGADLRPRFEVEAGLLEEQCRAKAREKMAAVMDDEFKKVDRAGKEDLPARGGEKPVGREPDSRGGAFQLEWENDKEAAALKLKEVRAESEAEAERLVTVSAISRNNLTGKFY
ncbi:hypothetical protein GIB67_016531 [Kingdonia uniflora]|uniref:Uncharacterized protein n=1 Tax=Kingdonia uniflora TaxID=39325 RepID=A0A7J7NQ90_9MAGN|nr:hypothetical protein GIB67_016531 [Kingdonia uniflora]